VQTLKIKILCLLTNEGNLMRIVDELSSVVSPHEPALSKAAIHALGEIGVHRARAATLVADKICSLLRQRLKSNDSLQHDCISVAKELLRKFAPLSAILLPVLTACFPTVEANTPAQVALVWVLGQFAGEIPEAPYLLESMIDDWQDTTAPAVQTHSLTEREREREGERKRERGRERDR
jgi:hypothetical protein